MTTPPTRRLSFRWTWRPHQRRVLRVMEQHLEDDRLHLVAAPGAGKTTLGLEVFRRLGRPTLALAPTLTIRDQWLRRLQDFLPEGGGDGERAWLAQWTSTDLVNPAFLTVTTYQALLSRSRPPSAKRRDTLVGARAPSAEDVASFTESLRAAGVGLLILDEAHHLRKGWWQALDSVVTALDDVTLLSLTATPPYDATGHEWRRYEQLCGPIDDEISVPELVKAGTLCPHQDFVYAVAPSEAEQARVHDHEQKVEAALTDLLDDPAFQSSVDAHPWIIAPEPEAAEVLERPEVAVALLSYLRGTGAGLPPGLMGTLELGSDELPRLDRRLWEILLREVLYGLDVDVDEEYRRALLTRLRGDGLLWRRRFRLVRSRPEERLLALSVSKISACTQIHDHEWEVRGESLRQVVLTDFIRDGVLEHPPGVTPTDLGALPIFDALVTGVSRSQPKDVALVSGRLTVVHETRRAALSTALPSGPDVRFSPLPHRPGWVQVEGPKSGRLVRACTALLAAGRLRVIVGTRSLLGEGWDAPMVNSLVLASYVGAFVSTNQMRGRAIRTDPRDVDKVASVWHLVAVAPGVPTGLLDHDQLRERFSTFVGLSADGATIESGIVRLGLPPPNSHADLAAYNRMSTDRLRDLAGIAAAWRSAIDTAEVGQVVPTIRFQRPPTLRPLHVRRTLLSVLYQTGWAAVAVAGEMLRSAMVGSARNLGTVLLLGGAVPFFALTPRLYRAARLAIKHAPIDGSVAQIGRALLDALSGARLVDADAVTVRTKRLDDGSVQVSLAGGTFYEQSLFIDALAELLGPIENPRYLITRPATNALGTKRLDYHAVPHLLGGKRELADALHESWKRHVGEGELIYTRREGGRAALLAARARAFANQFVDPAERLDRWQ